MLERESFDLQFHYFLKEQGVHSMNAIVFNDCEKQLIASLYQLADILEIDRNGISVEVLSRTEGGVVEWLKVKFSDNIDKMLLTAFSAFVGVWIANYFNSDINQANVTKTTIESAVKLKEAGFTQEEAEALVSDNLRLMEFCSKYYKSAMKEPKLERIETSVDRDSVNLYKAKINAAYFKQHVVEVKKFSNVVKGTTLKIASPVLADVKRLKWHGVFNQLPISFTIEDFDFIDKVHNRVVKFEFGTTIQCDLRIEETHAGNKVYTPKYVVEKVYSWYDGETLEIGEKRYLSIEDAEAEVIPNEIKMIEKKED